MTNQFFASRAKALRAAFCILVPIAFLATASAQRIVNPSDEKVNPRGQESRPEEDRDVSQEVREHPDTQLLLIGDSITDNYHASDPPDRDFRPTWDQFYAPRKALNLGFSGDTTDDTIWRLEHGMIDGLHPKVVVVLIGTNNTLHGQTAEQTEIGIDAVIGNLEERLPDARILMLGILPSDRAESKTIEDKKVNQYLARCYGENPRITYLDLGSIFYKNGVLNTALYYDSRTSEHRKALHPDTVGQRMMAEAIEPTLANLMQDAPRETLNAMTHINTASIAVPALEQDSYDWYARHHAELELQKHARPQVVMIGDSITHFWGGLPAGSIVNGPSAWSHVFGGMSVINMGFGWDRTQNVLWRLRQGELDGLDPKWIVLNIGTNNLTGSKNARPNTPEEVVEGVELIREQIRERSPASRLVLMAIFPRTAHPDTNLRKLIVQTNRLLKRRFAENAGITYLDIGSGFLTPDGTLPKAMMPDGTHPSEAGYRIWADALINAGIHP